MQVDFSITCGIAGDLQAMLHAKNEDGLEVTSLYNRVGWFKLRSLRKAKRKLLKELELLTGKTHYERK